MFGGGNRRSLLERLVNIEPVRPMQEPEEEPAFVEEVPVSEYAGEAPVEGESYGPMPGAIEFEAEEESDEAVHDAFAEPVRISVVRDTEPEYTEPVPARAEKRTYFDILERAKQLDETAREEIRIVYSVPKKVVSIPVRADNSYEDRRTLIDGEAVIVEHVEERQSFVPEDPEEGRRFVIETRGEEPVIEEIHAEPAHDLVESAPEEHVAHIVVEARAEEPLSRSAHFEKVLFPDQYFYLPDGQALKTAMHLRSALLTMPDETFEYHTVTRRTNDFANWVRGVYGHHECAERLADAKTRDEHIGILDAYL